MKAAHLKIALLLLAVFGLNPMANAQEQHAVLVPVAVEKGPEDALNRGTPRGSIVGFLEACSAVEFEKAAQFLEGIAKQNPHLFAHWRAGMIGAFA